MKRIIFGSLVTLLTATLLAQPPHPDGPPKPPPIAERWKHDSTKLQLYVVLSSAQISNVKNAFFSFYNEMDALMQASKTPPTPPAKEEVEKIISKRDLALKNIFNAQQFERFETFEKEFMLPPPPHQPMPRNAAEKV